MTARCRRRIRVALLTLCCLLLAQWSLATHACPLIRQAGELVALAEVEADAAPRAAHDCHGSAAMAVDPSPGQATLCLKHCADEGGASSGASLVFAAAAAPPLVNRAAPPAAAGPVHWERAPARSDATAPPLSILYCVSLT